jgi:galactose-1-phosphate uridylyltransferase
MNDNLLKYTDHKMVLTVVVSALNLKEREIEKKHFLNCNPFATSYQFLTMTLNGAHVDYIIMSNLMMKIISCV